MQNDTISYTHHTGEAFAQGAGNTARAVVPVGLGESVHEACCPTGTREGTRADGFAGVQKAARARENAHVASGRSMIEMLGVLAIIGALSVGGLAALRVAQNKVRANVIANDVMLAAADLLARQDVLTAGSVVNTFSFTPKTTTLTAEKCPEDANIEIMVSSVPQAVCEQVVRNGAVKGTQGIGVAKSGSAFCDGSTLNSSCSAGNNNLVFVLGANTRELCGGKYCEEGYYCRYSPSSCSDKGTGTCTANGGLPTASNKKVTLSSGTVYIGPSMDWWSAGNYCESLGLKRLEASKLGCGYDAAAHQTNWSCCTTSSSIDQNRSVSSICDAKRKSLGETDYTSYANSLASEFFKFKDSSVWSNYGWLEEEKGDNCYAYSASFGGGNVGSYTRNYRTFYALCQEE